MPTQRQLFRSELWMGIMGPSALAKQGQLLIHQLLDGERPNGWENQLPDHAVINYNIYYEPNLLSVKQIAGINGFSYTQLGTLLNSTEAGLTFFLSNVKDDLYPERVYDLDKKEAGRTIKLFIAVKPAVKFVAWNSILQGGFSGKKDYYHIPAEDLERIIIEGTGIMGLRIKNFSIQYRQVMETREFKTVQGHVYGSFAFTWKI